MEPLIILGLLLTALVVGVITAEIVARPIKPPGRHAADPEPRGNSHRVLPHRSRPKITRQPPTPPTR